MEKLKFLVFAMVTCITFNMQTINGEKASKSLADQRESVCFENQSQEIDQFVIFNGDQKEY